MPGLEVNATQPSGGFNISGARQTGLYNGPVTSYGSNLKGIPIVRFPGINPAKAPKGFIWRGKPGSKPGSKNGKWYNPKTSESLRPDLNHPNPIGPHWDYRDPFGNWWRIFPDGTISPK